MGCAFCVLGVCGAAWHAEKNPCVGSKRFRVCRQSARMLNTCGRFAGTHGSVLNLHTGKREGGVGGGSLFSLSLSSLRSLPSFSFSFSSLLSQQQ